MKKLAILIICLCLLFECVNKKNMVCDYKKQKLIENAVSLDFFKIYKKKISEDSVLQVYDICDYDAGNNKFVYRKYLETEINSYFELKNYVNNEKFINSNGLHTTYLLNENKVYEASYSDKLRGLKKYIYNTYNEGLENIFVFAIKNIKSKRQYKYFFTSGFYPIKYLFYKNKKNEVEVIVQDDKSNFKVVSLEIFYNEYLPRYKDNSKK